jgi:hypothetical protein
VAQGAAACAPPVKAPQTPPVGLASQLKDAYPPRLSANREVEMADNVQVRSIDAIEIPDLTGHKYKLEVTGEAYVPTTNTVATLKEAIPQGISDKILILELTLTASGIGGDAFIWKKIEKFEKPISARQYDEIDIHFKGASIAKVKVRVVKS